MKTLRLILALFVIALAITSCQKDFSFEAGNAKGSLGKTTAGDCDPIFVNGLYYIDTTMKATNFVDVQVDFSKIGTYTIKTDTINGYSFATTGSTGTLGLNTIRLFAKGKPIASGFDIFTVKFDGTQCAFNVGVIVGIGGGGGGTGAAVFSFGGGPAVCSGATLGGTYTSGVTMTAANNVTIPVTVTTAGTYTVTTSANGVTFSGSGTFTTTGSASLVLTAAGTPPTSATAVNTTYPISSGTSNCSFGVAYAATPAGGAAVFTFNCGFSPTINGTFAVGINTAGNTVTIPINPVTTAGTYNISTALNGVTLSNMGFLAAGATSLTLNASGTPTTAAYQFTNFMISYGTPASTCSITIPFTYGTLNFVNAGVTKNFTFNQAADSAVEAAFPPFPAGYSINVTGTATVDPMLDKFEFNIFRPNTYFVNGSTYDINSLASFSGVEATYTNAAGVVYTVTPAVIPQTPNFTVTITAITPNRVTGTFSAGTLTAVPPATGTYVIQSGAFDLPLN